MFPQRPQFKEFIQPLTHLTCFSCNTENSRPFRDGDYVFKEVEEKCPKCGSSRMLITGIYVEDRQIKERER